MDKYDDFALDPQKFELMAKEYTATKQIDALSVKVNDFNKQTEQKLFGNIEYLRVLTTNLKSNTSNKDILLVLNEIYDSITEQRGALKLLFDEGINLQENNSVNFDMFCNNLKLSIQTTGEIIKMLIAIKDSDNTNAQAKVSLTDIINQFIDINNKFVSLFGECQYLQYKKHN